MVAVSWDGRRRCDRLAQVGHSQPQFLGGLLRIYFTMVETARGSSRTSGFRIDRGATAAVLSGKAPLIPPARPPQARGAVSAVPTRLPLRGCGRVAGWASARLPVHSGPWGLFPLRSPLPASSAIHSALPPTPLHLPPRWAGHRVPTGRRPPRLLPSPLAPPHSPTPSASHDARSPFRFPGSARDAGFVRPVGAAPPPRGGAGWGLAPSPPPDAVPPPSPRSRRPPCLPLLHPHAAAGAIVPLPAPRRSRRCRPCLRRVRAPNVADRGHRAGAAGPPGRPRDVPP